MGESLSHQAYGTCRACLFTHDVSLTCRLFRVWWPIALKSCGWSRHRPLWYGMCDLRCCEQHLTFSVRFQRSHEGRRFGNGLIHFLDEYIYLTLYPSQFALEPVDGLGVQVVLEVEHLIPEDRKHGLHA